MIGDFRPLNPYCQCDVSSSAEITGGNFLHGNTCNSCREFLAYIIDLKLSSASGFVYLLLQMSSFRYLGIFWATFANTLVEEHEYVLITESTGTARQLKFIQEMTVTSNLKKDLTKTRCENFKVFLLCLQGGLECWSRGKEPLSVRSLKFESLWNQIGPRPLSLIPVHRCLFDNWAPGRSSYSPGCCLQCVLWRTSPHWSSKKERYSLVWQSSIHKDVNVMLLGRLKLWPLSTHLLQPRHSPSENSNNNRPFFSRQDLKW